MDGGHALSAPELSAATLVSVWTVEWTTGLQPLPVPCVALLRLTNVPMCAEVPIESGNFFVFLNCVVLSSVNSPFQRLSLPLCRARSPGVRQNGSPSGAKKRRRGRARSMKFMSMRFCLDVP